MGRPDVYSGLKNVPVESDPRHVVGVIRNMRAVIYCRVSTRDQVQNLSLPTQRRACIEYCQRNGYDVDRVFVEEGESAKTADRTELKKLLTYCRENKGRIHAVVVYAVNRFAREKYSHAVLRMQLAS